MGKTHKKIVMAGVCCLMISMLTGCGNDTTKITEGMQLVETLDYQGALTAFDEAEAQKENSRLIARGRGIASMGLTEYDQAVQYFTEALEAFQAGKQIEGNSLMQTLSFNEIVAYEYLQDYQKAAVLLKAYLQNYPDDQTAIREQQFLSTR